MDHLPVAFTFLAVGRTAPTILTLVAAAYLLMPRTREPYALWLGVYLFLLGVFNLAYLVAYSVDDPRAGYAWIPACSIAFAAVARLQFACVFPTALVISARERWLALLISGTAAIAALIDYILRAGSDTVPHFALYSYGSRYGSPFVPAVTVVCYLWSVVIGVRVARRIDRRNDPVAYRATLQMSAITLAELLVGGVHLLSRASPIDRAVLETGSNVAVLLIVSAYVMIYAIAARHRTGFMHRLVGVSLVTVLGLLTIMALYFRGPVFEQLRRDAARPGANDALALPATVEADPRSDFTRQDGFVFFRHDDQLYYGVEDGDAARPGYIQHVRPYAEFRARVHAFAAPFAAFMLAAALFMLFVFPLLFRASLLSPLRALTAELGAVAGRAREELESTEGPPRDEIATLRDAFRQMTDLLMETRAAIPEYAPQIERLHQVALGRPRRIELERGALVFRSQAMHDVVAAIERLGEFRHPVLITGETGTGKEIVARLLYESGRTQSPAEDAPFIAINCAALPEPLWESEIFGHRKGAFTDARADRQGRIVEAGTGTLFFDEIGEMPLSVQAKMLRLLQDQEFVPLGSDRALTARCRFVFATHRDLNAMSAAGEFRRDLLYRIQVFKIHVPPLRERPEDLQDLVPYFVERFAREHRSEIADVDPNVFVLFAKYRWPGNIRELENTLLRSLAFASGDTLLPAHLLAHDSGAEAGTAEHEFSNRLLRQGATGGPQIPFDQQVRDFSRALITQALHLASGNKSEAARLLGLKRTTLRNRMRDLGLAQPD